MIKPNVMKVVIIEPVCEAPSAAGAAMRAGNAVINVVIIMKTSQIMFVCIEQKYHVTIR
jgi:hypothetical protein